MHLVRPSCIVVLINLFRWKWARCASVHFSLPFFCSYQVLGLGLAELFVSSKGFSTLTLWYHEKNSVRKQVENQTQKIRRFNGELGNTQYAEGKERESESKHKKLYYALLKLYTSYVFSEHFHTSPYGLTEVLVVLQCSFMSPYTNSQIYSLRNICLMASRFPHRTGLCYAPVCVPVYAPDLTDRSQPIRSSSCSADPTDVELVSQHSGFWCGFGFDFILLVSAGVAFLLQFRCRNSHSCHGTVFLADCFAGAWDDWPLSLGVLRPISTINTGHKTASHSSIIGFIGLTFWTLWSYSLIATTIKYPLSVVWFCNLTMVNPARCFVIQYCRGLTNATSNKNFATSWKKTSSLSFVKYDFAEGKYSPEYDWRTSLSNVYMTLYASFFRFRNRRTCLFVIGWKHGNENN